MRFPSDVFRSTAHKLIFRMQIASISSVTPLTIKKAAIITLSSTTPTIGMMNSSKAAITLITPQKVIEYARVIRK